MLDTSNVERLDAEAVNRAATRQPLYAPRKKIFPKRATGSFRNFKWLVMLITLGIYYLTPWIRWDRGPHAPDQAVLVDFANRRFYFFFIEIWPQEFFIVAGLLVMAGIGLFLITSTVGRAWCGYACPQTVWVDLFLVVERWIEGERNARMKLDAGPWTVGKIVKRVSKHGTWILIAVATGGAWIFYFADAPTLAMDFMTGQAPAIAYITVAILTATTYTFGGLMREQVCTYMCPWPRIQAAMLDENSLTVTYNDWRGEPRTRGVKKAAAEGRAIGDCVDCNACVAVCPMGIDIRDGQQLECITCALCIDACDAIMDKTGKERGLIAYATLADYNHNMALATGDGVAAIDPGLVRGTDGRLIEAVRGLNLGRLIRPRTFVYLAIWGLVGVALLFALATRDLLEISVHHDRNPQYVLLSDGSIRNGYEVKLLNKIAEPRAVTLSLEGLEGATMMLGGFDMPEAREVFVMLEPDRLRNLRVFVRMPPDRVTAGTSSFTFNVVARQGPETASYSAIFHAPEANR